MVNDADGLRLRPDERWHVEPPGHLQYWFAREEVPCPPSPESVTSELLLSYGEKLRALIEAVKEAGREFHFADDDVAFLPDGAFTSGGRASPWTATARPRRMRSDYFGGCRWRRTSLEPPAWRKI